MFVINKLHTKNLRGNIQMGKFTGEDLTILLQFFWEYNVQSLTISIRRFSLLVILCLSSFSIHLMSLLMQICLFYRTIGTDLIDVNISGKFDTWSPLRSRVQVSSVVGDGHPRLFFYCALTYCGATYSNNKKNFAPKRKKIHEPDMLNKWF